GFSAAFGKQSYRLVYRTGPRVLKSAGNHCATLPLLRTFHIFSGVRGISSSLTPNGFSASMTALTTAGVAAIVPVSPIPLTPRGLTGEGVSVKAVSNFGK